MKPTMSPAFKKLPQKVHISQQWNARHIMITTLKSQRAKKLFLQRKPTSELGSKRWKER
jgi:hypothetical protein